MKRIIIATKNKGKVRDFKTLLPDYEVLSAADIGCFIEPEETGATFYENALIKARAISMATRERVVADDSGLMVTALNGEPGVFSARYSGEKATDSTNNALLLEKMQGVTDRSAKFVCCLVAYSPSGEIVTAEGECCGEILTSPKGENGFGYDSLFYSTELKKSLGEATDIEKSAVSHRGRALKKLKELL